MKFLKSFTALQNQADATAHLLLILARETAKRDQFELIVDMANRIHSLECKLAAMEYRS